MRTIETKRECTCNDFNVTFNTCMPISLTRYRLSFSELRQCSYHSLCQYTVIGSNMKRFLNAQAQSKLQKQAEPAEGTYEMVNTEKTAEAEYEIIDHNKKGVTLEDNPAYGTHTYHS